MKQKLKQIIYYFYNHKDKFYHFIIGFGLSLLGFIFQPLILTGFIAGIVKEIYDKMYPEKHTFDIWDAFWTIIGALLACYIIFYF